MDPPRSEPPLEAERVSDSGHPFRPFVLAVAMVLLLYPLSIGPMIRLLPAGPTKYSVITRVYAPILQAADHSEALHRFLEWYIYDLWRASPFETWRSSPPRR